MEAMLPTQPESYSQLIKRSLRLYRASFSSIMILSVLLSMLVFIPQLIAGIYAQDIFASLPLLNPYRLAMLLVDLAAFALFIAIIWRTRCVVRKRHEPLLEDVQMGAKKAFLGLIAAFILGLLFFLMGIGMTYLFVILNHYQVLFVNTILGVTLTSLLFLLIITLFFYVSTLFVFFLPLIAIEDKGILKSLQTSVLLVWNHWWRVFKTQLTPWFWYLIVLCLIRFALGIKVRLFIINHDEYDILITILHIILFALFIPWIVSPLLVQLKDLELRNHLLPKKTR